MLSTQSDWIHKHTTPDHISRCHPRGKGKAICLSLFFVIFLSLLLRPMSGQEFTRRTGSEVNESIFFCIPMNDSGARLDLRYHDFRSFMFFPFPSLCSDRKHRIASLRHWSIINLCRFGIIWVVI